VPTSVVGDEGRLRQILANLIGNAVKFTAAGYVLVTVNARVSDGVTLRVAVKDSGIGVSSDEQERLFEAFTQADDSVTRTYGGTGLGLAIARRLCEAMGGQISVDSELGRGSEFRFTVRLGVGEGAVEDRANRRELERMRVLIVAQGELGRDILEKQLRSWGAQCVAVSDDRSGFELLLEAAGRGVPFAAAIIVGSAPGIRARDMALRITADPRTRSCCAILSTNVRDADGDASSSLRCLSKPHRRSELFAALLSARDQGARRPAAWVARQPPQPSSSAPLDARVLLVEDNEVNIEVTMATLESFGCRVDVCLNGREALEALDRGGYDVILMDCQMPQMDGYEATKAIRLRTDGREKIPIVALTAHALGDEREKCLAAGMDDYLSKPFSHEELRAVLDWWRPRPSIRTSQQAVSLDPVDTLRSE
jgi:CheY-like chemotaxis protein